MNNIERPKKIIKNPWIMVSCKGTISPDMYNRLREISKERNVPMTALIARAIKNELECATPFEFNLNVDHIKYTDENTDDSQRLFDFISEHPGMCLEQLALCKENIGIETDQAVAIAYRQLVAIEMVLEYYPLEAKYSYPKGYRVVKIRPGLKMQKPNKRYKEIETENPLDGIMYTEEK